MGATPAGPSPPAKLVLTLPRCRRRRRRSAGRGPRAWVSGPTCAPRSLRRCPLARAARTGAAAGSRDPTAPAATLVAHGPLREPRRAVLRAAVGRSRGPGGAPGGVASGAPPIPRPSDSFAVPARFTGLELGPRRRPGGGGAWGSLVPCSMKSGGQGSAPRWPLDARAKAPVRPAFAVACARVFPRGRRAGFPRLEPRARWRKHCCCEGYLEGELEVF